MRAQGKTMLRSWTSACGTEVFEANGHLACPSCGEASPPYSGVTEVTQVTQPPNAMRAQAARASFAGVESAAGESPLFLKNFFKKAAYGTAAGALAVVGLGLHAATTAPLPDSLASSPVVAILWPAVVVGGLTGAAATVKRAAEQLWKKTSE